MKRSEISNKDELKRAFKQIKDEEFKDVPGEDEIPFEISDSFRDKVMTGSSKRMSAWGRVINSTAKKAAAVAAVSVITLGVLMSVKAIREPVVEFISMTYEKTAALFRAEEETTTVIPPDTSEANNTEDPDHVTASSLSENEDAKPGDDKTKPGEKNGKKDDKSKENVKKDAANGGAPNGNDNEASATAEPAPDDEVVETVEATCEQDGYTLMRRAGTDETYKTNIVPALGHDYELLKKVYSTCTVAGHAYYRCTRCDGTYDEELPLGAHNWVFIDSVKKCGQPSEYNFECSICRQTKTEYKERLSSHILETVKKVEPTCTEDGYIEYKCRDCGEIVTEEIPKLGHDYKTTILKSASCTEEGRSHTSCKRCKESYYSTIPKLAHRYNEYYEAPTCTEEGYILHECCQCGYSYNDSFVPALGHDLSTKTIGVSCTKDGGTYIYCVRCGEEFDIQDRVPAPGHDYVLTDHIDPTCVNDGRDIYECTRCKKIYTETIKSTGEHNYCVKKMIYTPSCTTEGYTLYACPGCGKTEKRDFLPALGHDFQAWQVVEPTETEQGYTIYKCTRCKAKENRDFVPAQGSMAAVLDPLHKLSLGQITAIPKPLS